MALPLRLGLPARRPLMHPSSRACLSVRHHIIPAQTHGQPGKYESPAAIASTIPSTAPVLSAEEVAKARAHCTSMLQTFDHPAHLLRAFIPAQATDAYLAIRAFNLDIAHVADAVSRPEIGRMRMQFWRDALTAVFNSHSPASAREPSMILLAAVLASGVKLGKGWFLRNISARESLLDLSPFQTLTALETYSENTYSSLQYLQLEALGLYEPTLEHISSHIGKAAGIAALLRGVPLTAFPAPAPTAPTSSTFTSNTRQGAVLLPLDACAKHNMRQEDVLRSGGNAPGLRDVVFEVATLANDHLLTAQKMIKDAGGKSAVDKNGAWGTLMSAVPTKAFLERLEKVDFDVFHPSLVRREWKLPWKAYWAYNRGTLL